MSEHRAYAVSYVDGLLAEGAALHSALQDVFDLIDQNWLVRNIKNDDDPLWALQQLNQVRRLAKAKEVLDSASGTQNR